jgi:Zn-dependent protease
VLLGWAKPVPFNPAYFRNPKKGMMIVGAAGPAANLALAVVAAVVFRLFTPSGMVGFFLVNVCVINVILALFNLIPSPPLDGSRVVAGLLPLDLTRSYLKLERFGFLIIFGLLWIGALDNVIWPLADGLLQLLLPR